MTSERKDRILVVDDDQPTLNAFTILLETNGYQVSTAATAKQAIEKAKTTFYDLALIDIRLTDMEGTVLLSQMQDVTPETLKIMMTGFPSVQNTVESLNLGAKAYITKPSTPEELLLTIKEKLAERKHEDKITKNKVAEWVRTQVFKRSSPFDEFLEETASELSEYGLTKTQAKVYITLNGLGLASASEIANLSKVRREEVYRSIPVLEEKGIILRMEHSRKFFVVSPEKVVELLLRRRLSSLNEEIEKLNSNKSVLIHKLKTVEMPFAQGDTSSDVIP